MIMTFDEIRENAIRNSRNIVREKIVLSEPRNYDRVNYISQVVGLAISTTLFVISILF